MPRTSSTTAGLSIGRAIRSAPIRSTHGAATRRASTRLRATGTHRTATVRSAGIARPERDPRLTTGETLLMLAAFLTLAASLASLATLTL